MDLQEIDVFEQTVMHLRLKQRRNRKFITIVEGLPPCFDQKKILRAWKQSFSCNGNIIYEEQQDKKDKQEQVKEIVLTGDQREHVSDFLQYMGIATKENIKIHGI